MSSSVKSAIRAIEILEYFAAGQGPASVTQVAADLGYPQSSTTFLLQTLWDMGYLDYDHTVRRYRAAERIALLGADLAETLIGCHDRMNAMKALLQATERPVIIGLRRGINTEYLRLLQPPSQIFSYHMGTRTRPLVRSALGKALLARLPDAEIGRIVRRINAEERDPAARIPEPVIMQELAEVRVRGYADIANHIPGYASIAASLPVRDGEAPVAIGLTTEVEEMGRRRGEFVQHLLEIVADIRRTLEAEANARSSMGSADSVGVA
jgi:DNA-binding IclR family transcriptional regulator